VFIWWLKWQSKIKCHAVGGAYLMIVVLIIVYNTVLGGVYLTIWVEENCYNTVEGGIHLMIEVLIKVDNGTVAYL